MGSATGCQQGLIDILNVISVVKSYKLNIAESLLERLFWVAVVLAGFSGASLLVYEAVVEWISHPSGSLRLSLTTF